MAWRKSRGNSFDPAVLRQDSHSAKDIWGDGLEKWGMVPATGWINGAGYLRLVGYMARGVCDWLDTWCVVPVTGWTNGV